MNTFEIEQYNLKSIKMYFKPQFDLTLPDRVLNS